MNQQEILNTLANILQIYNTMLLQDDAKNNDIIEELNKQNKQYLEQIINKLDEILEYAKNNQHRNT